MEVAATVRSLSRSLLTTGRQWVLSYSGSLRRQRASSQIFAVCDSEICVAGHPTALRGRRAAPVLPRPATEAEPELTVYRTTRMRRGADSVSAAGSGRRGFESHPFSAGA
jgi:hypothetical protein